MCRFEFVGRTFICIKCSGLCSINGGTPCLWHHRLAASVYISVSCVDPIKRKFMSSIVQFFNSLKRNGLRYLLDSSATKLATLELPQ